MKKILATLTAFIAFTAITMAADAPKILTIDLGQALNGYWKLQQEAEKFNSSRQNFQKELQTMGQALEELGKKHNALQAEFQSPAISEERKAAIQQEVMQLRQEAAQKQQEAVQFQQTNEQAMLQNEQAFVESCHQDIREAVAVIAEQEKADFVLRADIVLYTQKDATNITEKVLKLLNDKKPQSPSAK